MNVWQSIIDQQEIYSSSETTDDLACDQGSLTRFGTIAPYLNIGAEDSVSHE